MPQNANNKNGKTEKRERKMNQDTKNVGEKERDDDNNDDDELCTCFISSYIHKIRISYNILV